MTSYWAVAQTVSKMEHVVLREIEKKSHGAFLPTYAKNWKVDGRDYRKEYPLLTGYVFFLTKPDDWAGIPDIHGVYGVLANPPNMKGERTAMRVTDAEMQRLVIPHATGDYNESGQNRYTKYYRPSQDTNRSKQKRRRPRPGRRIRNATAA